MFDSIKNEPKDVKDLIKQILRYHFESNFAEPISESAKVKQVIAWIESAAKKK